jgi:hypothetical protein
MRKELTPFSSGRRLYCSTMRRSIALSLLMIFSWMLIAPLLAPDAEAALPACCRRNGKHHCMMGGMEQTGGKDTGLTSVSAKCPCVPSSTAAVHAPTYKPEAGTQFYAEIVRHPACAPQTEARFRISFLRSHQRRGPPSPLA